MTAVQPDPLAGLFSPEWRAYDAVARALPDCDHNRAWRALGPGRPVPPDWFRPELPLLLEIQRLRRAHDRQASRLPEQVPIAEICALVKAVRDTPLTATLTATRRVDLSGQERSGAPKVAGQEGVST